MRLRADFKNGVTVLKASMPEEVERYFSSLVVTGDRRAQWGFFARAWLLFGAGGKTGRLDYFFSNPRYRWNKNETAGSGGEPQAKRLKMQGQEETPQDAAEPTGGQIEPAEPVGGEIPGYGGAGAVSYTHLTLPTT